MTDRYYDRRELAEKLKVSVRTVRKWDAMRKIPGRTPINARVIRYFAPAVDAWIKSRQQ